MATAVANINLEELEHVLEKATVMGLDPLSQVVPANFVAVKIVSGKSQSVLLKSLLSVQSPYVLRFVSQYSTQQKRKVYLVSDSINGAATFYDRLAQELEWQQVIKVIAGVASGLAQIHAAGLVHRDIKPQNVVVTEDFHPIIADLGLIQLQGDVSDSIGLTYGYFTKEDVNEGLAKASQDVYALGIFILQAITKRQSVFATTTPICTPHILDSVHDAMKQRGHAVDVGLLSRGCSSTQATIVTHIALRCIQCVQKRPNSHEVEKILKKEFKMLQMVRHL